MTDTDLDNLYKQNLPTSHAAGLRGVFDAGAQSAAGQQPVPPEDDSASVSDATAVADTPQITTV